MEKRGLVYVLCELTSSRYSLAFATQQQAIIGALAMKQLGIQAIIENADDDYVTPTHDVALAFNVCVALALLLSPAIW